MLGYRATAPDPPRAAAHMPSHTNVCPATDFGRPGARRLALGPALQSSVRLKEPGGSGDYSDREGTQNIFP